MQFILRLSSVYLEVECCTRLCWVLYILSRELCSSWLCDIYLEVQYSIYIKVECFISLVWLMYSINLRSCAVGTFRLSIVICICIGTCKILYRLFYTVEKNAVVVGGVPVKRSFECLYRISIHYLIWQLVQMNCFHKEWVFILWLIAVWHFKPFCVVYYAPSNYIVCFTIIWQIFWLWLFLVLLEWQNCRLAETAPDPQLPCISGSDGGCVFFPLAFSGPFLAGVSCLLWILFSTLVIPFDEPCAIVLYSFLLVNILLHVWKLYI